MRADEKPVARAAPPEVPDDEIIDLAELFDVLRRRRRQVLFVCGAVTGLAVALAFILPKRYRSTTTLQIERGDVGTVAIEDLFRFEGLTSEYYETQHSLLQSRGLAERVVESLGLEEDPDFNPPRSSWFGPAGEAASDAVVLGGLATRLLENLEVDPIRRTHLVEISYVAPTPVLAARVANGVADAYIDWGIQRRNYTVGRASSFLSSQIEALKQEISSKEAQLQAYSRSTDIVALDPQSNVTIQGLEALNRDYTAAVSLRIEKESRYRELRAASPDAIADTLSGELIADLRSAQAQLERDYANKLATYKPEWPAMQELEAQIEKGQQNLDAVIEETVEQARQSARTEYQTALRREQSLATELQRKKREAMELNSAAVEYNNLQVEVSTRRQLLDELLRRQSETMVASRLGGSEDSNVIVVDRALPPTSVHRPSLKINLVLGLGLGVVLGVGVVFLLEYLDRSLKTPEQVERVLKLPVLAVIPDVTARVRGYGYGYGQPSVQQPASGAGDAPPPIERLPHEHPRHAASESYRSLRTALLLSRADGLSSVVVTSAGPAEGKSTTVANLAVVLAQLGRRVLLVDADLRKPRQHEIFGLSNRSGLVSLLTGAGALHGLVTETGLGRLGVLPSGPIPPNPSELLSSAAMRELDALARSEGYDTVLYDAPPVLPVTDATLLGRLADGVVLCVRAGRVPRESALSCKRRLERAGVKTLGVVLNAYEPQGRYEGSYQPYQEQVGAERPNAGAA